LTGLPHPLEQGVALLGGGRFHEALQQFAQALQQQPAAAEPRIGLAQACQGIGDGWAAAAWLSDACRVAPRRPELWLELAKLLVGQKREAELEHLLLLAVAVNPDHAPLLQMQGELYLRLHKHALALPAYTRLFELQPDDPRTLLHFGYCHEQTGGLDKAVALYQRALARQPDFMEAHVDLAGVLWRVEDFEGSLTHGQKAVALAPQHPYAVRILGTALLNLNRLDEAEVQLRRSLELMPDFALAQIDLAFALLLAGKLEEGWKRYADRWNDADRMKRPAFFSESHEWKGPAVHPVREKSVAVYAEQGLGDVVQFLRYVPLLQAQGARVFCVIQPELVPLVEHSMEGVLCLTAQREFRADHHAALLDLPMHFGTTLENIPGQAPYLRAPVEKVAQWQERMPPAEGRLRVGLAWSGSTRQVNNGNRALRLSSLIPLMNLPEVQCFSLQKADVGPLTDVAPGTEQLVDFTPEWTDFTDSAAMIANLDLVITVDTVIAHLAGALGKEVWVMLPPSADWRWLLDRDDSPWYPTMRLFRRGFGEPRWRQVDRVMQALRVRLPAQAPA
jgi:tetratricopeptide (TPR) repeat protein